MLKKHNSNRCLHIGLAFLGLMMAGVSAYLTDHYYHVHFPKNFSVGSFCDISSFWNCDHAAFSVFSNILSIPTSLFGLAFGLIITCGALLRKTAFTQTNFFLAIANFLGCVFLFIYSLWVLGGLCPGCTVYYILSALSLIILYLFHLKPIPNIKVLATYTVLILTMSLGTYFYNKDRSEKQEEFLARWITEMRQEKIYDESFISDNFLLLSSTPNFSDAPLRITLFSDFQCPFCKLLSHELEKIESRYKNLINIRYVFFPLKNHPFAFSAAQLAYCARDQFKMVHDTIYENQNDIDQTWLDNYAHKLGLDDCFKGEASKKAIAEIVEKASVFELEAAPTMLVNGRKLSGLLPAKALIALFDAFLADAELLKKKNER
jgi:predicted DsbA family dithiol-disulfide isomerase/uncharacterized membrane protein